MEVNVGFICKSEPRGNYWEYAVTTIVQMLKKTDPNNFYNIYIVTNSKIDWEKYISKVYKNQNYKIIVLPPPSLSPKSTTVWSDATFWKFSLWKKLSYLNKLIISDIDIFFECDVAKAYTLDNSNVHLLGKIDWDYAKFIKKRKEWNKIPENIRYKFGEQCFIPFHKKFKNKEYMNAGFMLINPALLKKDEVIKHLSDNTTQNEQSMINFSSLKTKALPVWCNVFPTHRNIALVHKYYKEVHNATFSDKIHKRIYHYSGGQLWNTHKASYIKKPRHVWQKIYKEIFQKDLPQV